MTVLDVLLGRPLASDEARAECVGPAAGIPIFGLDALSSAPQAHCYRRMPRFQPGDHPKPHPIVRRYLDKAFYETGLPTRPPEKNPG